MKIISFFILIVISYTLNSQVWLEPFIGRYNVKLSEIQVVAEEHFSHIDISKKGSGFKQYKRFEAFWKDRLMPDGTFPKSSLIYKELNIANSGTKYNQTQSSNTWQSLGPVSSTGGYSGLARVNGVRVNPHNGDLWAATPSGGAWVSTDNGNNWHTITDNEDIISSIGTSSIAFDPNNSNIIYLASGDGDGSDTYSLGVLKTTDGGDSWNTTGLDWNVTQYRTINKIIIDPSNSNILYTAGSNGVYKTTDAGANWTQILTGVYKDIEFKPNSSSTIYVSGAYIKRTTNGGTTWSDLTNGLPTSGIKRTAIAVTKDSASVIYALVGKSSLEGVYLSTDSGDSFTQIADDKPNYLGYAKDGNDEKGQVWYDLCIEANQDDWRQVILGGINLWRTLDAGANWEIASMWSGNHGDVTTVHADQHDLWYDNTNNIMYVGNDGGVYKSTDFGDNWIWIGSGIKATQFYRFGISQTDSTIYLGGAQDNGTKIHRYNGTWKDAIGGDGFETLVDSENDSIMYGSLYYGAFYKSTNTGISFYRINDTNHNNKYDDISEGGAWSTPFIQNPSNSSTLLIGMNNVWISRDKGDNFTKISDFNYGGHKLVCLAMSSSDTNVIYAAFNTRLYSTTDYGITWNMQTRPGNSNISYIFVDDSNSNKIWATNSGYSAGNKVFESTDGGNTWTNISKNLPNLPVLTVIKQKGSKDKLWIGNDVGVYFTDSDMSEWIKYDNGLPNVIVNELEINYKYNQIYAATYGRGIWKVDIPSSLETPVIALPVDSSYGNQTNNLEVDWNDINSATKYIIEVSKNNDFSTILVKDTVSTSRYFIATLENYTTYYARIKAISTYSVSGWSKVHTFTTIVGRVTLVSPTNNEEGRNITGKLTWSLLAGATEYELTFADNQDFNNPIVNQAVNDTKFDYSNLSYFKEYWWKVRGKDPSGSYGDWSFQRKFQTIVDKPTLINPVNQSENIEIAQTFDWNDVTGADNYSLQISDKIDFSDLFYNSKVSVSEAGVTNLQHFKKYYWRVNAENQTNAGAWSDVFEFITKIGLTTNKLPDNNSINLDTVLTVLWNDESYADSYDFQIDYSPDFNTPSLFEMSKTSNTLMVDGLYYDTTYYWRTKINVGANSGDWGEVWSFRTKLKEPNLTSPLNNSSDIAINGILKWTNSANAPYRVQVATDIGFNNLIKDEIVSINEYSYSNLKNDTKYYWRVRAERGQYLSDWSEIYNFNTPLTIDRPQLNYPPNLQRNLKLVTLNLKWNELANVTSYKLQIASDNTFNNLIVNDSGLTDNNYDFVSLDYNMIYFWRVKGVRSQSNESEWSAIWEFSTTLPIPELSLPLNNAIGVDTAGIMKWNSITGADTYNIEVATDNGFVDKIPELTTKETGNQITFNDLDFETTYFWRVNAENNIALSEWSEVWKFTIDTADTAVSYISEDKDFGTIKVVPNPFESSTSISINLLESSNIKLYITDINGKHIFDIANKYFKASQDYNFQFEKGNLSSGIYFLILKYNNTQKSIKLIIN